MRSITLGTTVALQGLTIGGCLSGCVSGDEDAHLDIPDPAATTESVPDDWDAFRDPVSGISLRYSRDFGTTYIQPLDWPPQARLEPGPFGCTEAGEETARAGRTEPVTINGRTYCVTRVTEGAAGSIYTMYAYALPVGDDVVILTFSTRVPQCGNYDDPERSACERERETFSIDAVVDAIARTVELPE